MCRLLSSHFNFCSLLKHHIIFLFHLGNQLKVPLAKNIRVIRYYPGVGIEKDF